MKPKHIVTAIVIILIICLGVVSFLISPLWVAPRLFTNTPISQNLYQGINYQRRLEKTARPMMIHIVTVDLRQPGVSLMVTPGNPKAELPLAARTTAQFLEDFKMQMAINGDGFSPWRANGPSSHNKSSRSDAARRMSKKTRPSLASLRASEVRTASSPTDMRIT